MSGCMKVFCGVLVRGAVAAAHVSALETQAQMHPPAVHLETLFAPVRRARLDVAYLVEMGALLRSHGNDPRRRWYLRNIPRGSSNWSKKRAPLGDSRRALVILAHSHAEHHGADRSESGKMRCNVADPGALEQYGAHQGDEVGDGIDLGGPLCPFRHPSNGCEQPAHEGIYHQQ